MSHSSVEVTYRPEGPGHRARTARVDLARIPDPEAWLTNRVGPLTSFGMVRGAESEPAGGNHAAAARLDTHASRLTASMQAVLATHRTALDTLASRLEAAAPARLRQPSPPTSEQETHH